jgi:PEP-CTERM motif
MKLILCAVTLASISTLSAGVIFWTEGAGASQTGLGGTTVVDFNALAAGALGTYTSSIGTYSSGAQIVAPDIFGGAQLTSYVSVGVQSNTLSYSLLLNSPQSYFGLYWMAADPANLLQFYNGSTLVASYTGGSITAGLSPAYYGDPFTSTNANEAYVFVNFLSDNVNTNFTKVVFSNVDAGTGFESDNHTVLTATNTSSVPEPSAVAMLLTGLGAIAVSIRRRK